MLVAGTAVGTNVDVGVLVGGRVGIDAPGVRKTFIQTGWVRMAGSMASTNPTGPLFRPPLLRSRLDPISAPSLQRGEKRSAHCPAMNTHRSPNKIMIRTINQSRRSCSTSFMRLSVDGQSDKDCCAGKCCLIKTGALQPDASMMCIDDAACDGKSQARTAAPEFGLAGGMQQYFACLIELFEYELMIFGINTNASIFDGNLNLGFIEDTATNSDTASIGRVFDRVDDHMIKKFIQ